MRAHVGYSEADDATELRASEHMLGDRLGGVYWARNKRVLQQHRARGEDFIS